MVSFPCVRAESCAKSFWLLRSGWCCWFSIAWFLSFYCSLSFSLLSQLQCAVPYPQLWVVIAYLAITFSQQHMEVISAEGSVKFTVKVKVSKCLIQYRNTVCCGWLCSRHRLCQSCSIVINVFQEQCVFFTRHYFCTQQNCL